MKFPYLFWKRRGERVVGMTPLEFQLFQLLVRDIKDVKEENIKTAFWALKFALRPYNEVNLEDFIRKYKKG